jgi:hypothetical protein
MYYITVVINFVIHVSFGSKFFYSVLETVDPKVFSRSMDFVYTSPKYDLLICIYFLFYFINLSINC